jgi:hypothetical protein
MNYPVVKVLSNQGCFRNEDLTGFQKPVRSALVRYTICVSHQGAI